MLRDAGGSDAGYGMFTADYHPKKSATYLHNLTTILADKGAAPPGRLGYSIPDKPATMHDLLLRKSNGAFELLVWNEKASGADAISVSLASLQPAVRLYDPTVGTDTLQTLAKVRAVPLTLSDHPVILEFGR
jgi:hypothetical protein